MATILTIEGPATLKPDGRGQTRALSAETHPGSREIIETSDASRVAISLLPNLLVQLDHDTRLEIVRLIITKNGNESATPLQGRYASVKLLKGRMLVSHDWGEALAKFTALTTQGELVTTSNALFYLDSDIQKTRVTCVSGSVGFLARDASSVTRIPAGFVGEWSESGATLAAAESDARAQEDLQEGLEIEEKLRALNSRNSLQLPR